MKADDGRQVLLAREARYEVEDVSRGGGVEACHGLVGKDELSALHESPRNADALLLATGEPVGTLKRFVEKSNAIEAGHRQQPVLARERKNGVDAADVRQPPVEHVGVGGKASDEVMLLEHHRGGAPVSLQSGRSGKNGLPVGADDVAMGGSHEAVEGPEENSSCRRQRDLAAR